MLPMKPLSSLRLHFHRFNSVPANFFADAKNTFDSLFSSHCYAIDVQNIVFSKNNDIDIGLIQFGLS